METLDSKILNEVKDLPEDLKKEALSYIEKLRTKYFGKSSKKEPNKGWFWRWKAHI